MTAKDKTFGSDTHGLPLQDSEGHERRRMLTQSAFGAALALVGFAVNACGDDKKTDSGSGGSGGQVGSANTGGTSKGGATTAGGDDGGGAGGADGVADADVAPLNALLAAEYNAITAYTAGAGLIGDAPVTDPLASLRAVLVQIALSIQAQHKLHAASLVAAIQALGGKPVTEASVVAQFQAPKGLLANASIGNTLKFAASAERAAAVAYNQAMQSLEDAKLRFLATCIEGDETQHFIVLTALVVGLVAPGSKLDAKTAATVFPAAFVSSVGAAAGLDKALPDYYP
jgi:hypothetical protein